MCFKGGLGGGIGAFCAETEWESPLSSVQSHRANVPARGAWGTHCGCQGTVCFQSGVAWHLILLNQGISCPFVQERNNLFGINLGSASTAIS